MNGLLKAYGGHATKDNLYIKNVNTVKQCMTKIELFKTDINLNLPYKKSKTCTSFHSKITLLDGNLSQQWRLLGKITRREK